MKRSASLLSSLRSVSAVRGMRDLGAAECALHRRIEECARSTAQRYGYREVSTPCVEQRVLFDRALGGSSDVVMKEMYELQDAQPALVLRPENTAGAVRALFHSESANELPVRWFYSGKMWRRERPQRGRLREFTQLGVELFDKRSEAQSGGSSDAAVWLDAELIMLGQDVLRQVVPRYDARCKLKLNCLGDAAARHAYSQRLQQYLDSYRSQLSPESQERLRRGAVLRVLDSKDAADREVVAGAPVLRESVSSEAVAAFERLCGALRECGVAFEEDPLLVRGLDYYQDTVFEFVCSSSKLGSSQATVLAGGRYDALLPEFQQQSSSQFGKVGGAGWSAGVERLALVAERPARDVCVKVALVALERGAQAMQRVARVRKALAGCNVSLEVLHGHVAKSMRKADRRAAKYVLFVGQEELERGEGVKVKQMESGEESYATLQQLRAMMEARK